jgi:hypothetical protein
MYGWLYIATVTQDQEILVGPEIMRTIGSSTADMNSWEVLSGGLIKIK